MLAFSGTVDLENCTVTGNTSDADQNGTGGGGGVAVGTAILTSANTIVADNTDEGFEHPDIAGVVTSLGYNLIGTVGLANFASNTAGDIYGDPDATTTANPGAVEFAGPVYPGLLPLADNGGFTPTHQLLATSPAHDTGDPGTTVTVGPARVRAPGGRGVRHGCGGRHAAGRGRVRRRSGHPERVGHGGLWHYPVWRFRRPDDRRGEHRRRTAGPRRADCGCRPGVRGRHGFRQRHTRSGNQHHLPAALHATGCRATDRFGVLHDERPRISGLFVQLGRARLRLRVRRVEHERLRSRLLASVGARRLPGRGHHL